MADRRCGTWNVSELSELAGFSEVTTPDYSTWLTKQQAATALGCSTKTVEQFAKDRKIEQAVWRRPTGGPALAVYNPDDVSRIAAERRPAAIPFVLPPVPAGTGNGHGVIARQAPAVASAAGPSGEDVLRLVFAAALRALSAEPAAPSENSEKPAALFLTIPEAAAVSGLSRTYITRACASGTLKAIRDGRRWRIRRTDLEAL